MADNVIAQGTVFCAVMFQIYPGFVRHREPSPCADYLEWYKPCVQIQMTLSGNQSPYYFKHHCHMADVTKCDICLDKKKGDGL